MSTDAAAPSAAWPCRDPGRRPPASWRFDASGGRAAAAGQASLGATAAAIGNAVCAVFGVRVHDLPMTPRRLIAAIEAQA